MREAIWIRCRSLSFGTVGIQHIPYLPSESVWRERLLKKCDFIINDTVMNNRVFRITRKVKHSHLWAGLQQAGHHLLAAHLGHYDIGDQRVNYPGVVSRDFQGF